MTSHQLFHQVLSANHPVERLGGISFTVHQFSLGRFASLCSVTTSKVRGKHRFSIEQRQQKQSKLPFGLKPVPRKRKVADDPAKAKAKARKRTATNVQNAENAADTHRLEYADASHVAAGDVSMPASSQPVGLAHSSSESDANDSGFGSDCGVDDDADSISSESSNKSSGEDLVEQPLLIPAASAEASRVETALDEHKSDLEKRGDVQISRGGLTTDPPVPAVPQGNGKASSSTFCNKEVGLVAVGIQTAAKLATCRHCMQKIARHDPRFGYAWSRIKFHSWLHAKCLVAHLKQEGADKLTALEFLEAKLTEDLPEAAKDATSNVVAELRAEVVWKGRGVSRVNHSLNFAKVCTGLVWLFSFPFMGLVCCWGFRPSGAICAVQSVQCNYWIVNCTSDSCHSLKRVRRNKVEIDL